MPIPTEVIHKAHEVYSQYGKVQAVGTTEMNGSEAILVSLESDIPSYCPVHYDGYSVKIKKVPPVKPQEIAT